MQPGLIVLGNGPSLRGVALEALNGVATIGMNAAYRHWDRIGWSPTFYACADHRLALSHLDFIDDAARSRRFEAMLLPASVIDALPHLVDDPRVMFVDQLLPYWYAHYGASAGLAQIDSPYFRSSRPSLVTTGGIAIRWARHLGFRRLGLMGIDGQYQPLAAWKTEPDGPLALSIERRIDQNPNYFFDDYQRPGDAFNIPEPDLHGGTLHRDAIIAARDDLATVDPATTIEVLSPRSELARAGLFAVRNRDDFIDRTGIATVILDETGLSAEVVIAMLHQWDTADAMPYRAGIDPRGGTLIVRLDPAVSDVDLQRTQAAIDQAFWLGAIFSSCSVRRDRQKAAALIAETGDRHAGFCLYVNAAVTALRPNWLHAIEEELTPNCPGLIASLERPTDALVLNLRAVAAAFHDSDFDKPEAPLAALIDTLEQSTRMAAGDATPDALRVTRDLVLAIGPSPMVEARAGVRQAGLFIARVHPEVVLAVSVDQPFMLRLTAARDHFRREDSVVVAASGATVDADLVARLQVEGGRHIGASVALEDGRATITFAEDSIAPLLTLATDDPGTSLPLEHVTVEHWRGRERLGRARLYREAGEGS